ncbi:hypothetical protein [Companilactobacillus sp. HBUAS56257]|uniref:hypothetical protein n=1 Tax=Companilactobacillus sp. HBUAS56257 TaxID=3109360 RepID=UPI002FF3C574
MSLKIGGSNVGKIMYGGQEFGGATKLEPGTILLVSQKGVTSLKNAHLLSTTKNWSNINSINIAAHFEDIYNEEKTLHIPSDDFKNLDIEKKYTFYGTLTISRSIVDGEYRLNISGIYSGLPLVIMAA